MAIHITLTKNNGLGLSPIFTNPQPHSAMQVSSAQPRRTGPIVSTFAAKPNTMKQKIKDALLNGPQNPYRLANRLNAGYASVTATIRDLRKEGMDIQYNWQDSSYHLLNMAA